MADILTLGGLDRLVGPPMLEQVVAFPCETALAIGWVITGGLLMRHPGLRFLIDSFGMSQLMIGSDYPFSIMERQPVARLAGLKLSEADLDRLLFGRTFPRPHPDVVMPVHACPPSLSGGVTGCYFIE